MLLKDIIGDYEKFLAKVLSNLNGVGVDVSGFKLDHFAYRAKTNESYERLMGAICTEYGSLLEEVIIRDRRVAVIALNAPIVAKGFEVPYIEIMAPATGDKFPEGLEHAEFVVPDLNAMIRDYPNLRFEFKEKPINSELILSFDNNANVKFHTHDIFEVVMLQRTIAR